MPVPLTFGVEFEFNIAALPDGVPDPHPNDRRPVYGLCGPRPWELVLRDWSKLESFKDYCRRIGLVYNPDFDPGEKAVYGLESVEAAAELEDEAWDTLISNVSAALRNVGLPARADLIGISVPGNEHDMDSGRVTEKWEVTTDPSVHGPRIGDPKYGDFDRSYRYWPIELRSPAYYFCPEALDAIRLAMQTLTKCFRININESCGLHVHVGNEMKGFTFKTVQNLESFLWIFESQFSSLHPESRQNDRYFKSARIESRLGTDYGEKIPEIPGPDSSEETLPFGQIREPKYNRQPVMDALNTIWETTDIHALEQLMACPSGKMAYNILNLLPDPAITGDERKNTVEFRQHEACFDADRVVAWIHTVVALITIASDVDDFDFTEMLVEAAKKDDREGKISIKIVDLMRDLGISSPAAFYDRWLNEELRARLPNYEFE